MDQDEQHIVEDEPLKVLNLFPKREASILTLNYQNYSKLYENLTCTICRQLLKSPVYLKCSHRFCKECIQKYIRTSTKRSCPNCRGELTTKRDLRCDYSLQSLITFAFADVKSFAASMEEFDKIDIQRGKSLQIRRIDSQAQSKQRTRQQTSEQIVTPGFKRTKTNESEEPKRKRKLQSEKKLESKVSLDKEDKEKEISPIKKSVKISQEKQLPKQPQSKMKSQAAMKTQPAVSIQTFTREKSKKKKIQVIQIQSNSAPQEHEVQEIRRQQFFNPVDLGQQKNICSISVIPEALPQVQSSKKIFSFQEFPLQARVSFDQPKDVQFQIIQEKMQVLNFSGSKPQENMQEKMEIEEKEVNPEILHAVQLLKTEFGDNFPQKIIQLTTFPFYTQLFLKKHPQSFLTPQVMDGIFTFSLRSPVSAISAFISQTLNLNRESIKLYVDDVNDFREGYSYIQANQSLKLYEANEKYWKNRCNIELLQLIEVINSDCGWNQKVLKAKTQRIVYYSIDFSKIAV